MKYDPDKHHRHTIRLQGYDYSQNGAYFVTICTQNKECLFGTIEDNVMRLNDAGLVVADEWQKTAEIRAEIELDEWVVMPNHLHGILIISDGVVAARCRGDRLVAHMIDAEFMGDQPVAPTVLRDGRLGDHTGPAPRSVGAAMAGFKSVVTKRINTMRGTPGAQLWQRNYYEHVVRDDDDLNRIKQYIIDNPAQWATDEENPIALHSSPKRNQP